MAEMAEVSCFPNFFIPSSSSLSIALSLYLFMDEFFFLLL
uniref:Uncharacterized protein n=1 Tax=Rhizophora mucronata TaxID=61149 RepID=A0A2P2KUK3_RHIMU